MTIGADFEPTAFSAVNSAAETFVWASIGSASPSAQTTALTRRIPNVFRSCRTTLSSQSLISAGYSTLLYADFPHRTTGSYQRNASWKTLTFLSLDALQ